MAPHFLTVRSPGSPAEHRARRNVLGDARLPRRGHALADLQVTGDTDLACEDDKILQLGTSGNPDVRADDTMFTNGHVVPDLDQIIDLGAAPDPGLGKTGSVNTCMGPNFHLVPDNNNSDLRQSMMATGIRVKPETIGAQDDT